MSDYCMHVFLGPLRLLVVALSVRSIMLHSCKLCPTKSRFILSVVNVSCSLTVNQIFFEGFPNADMSRCFLTNFQSALLHLNIKRRLRSIFGANMSQGVIICMHSVSTCLHLCLQSHNIQNIPPLLLGHSLNSRGGMTRI